MESYSFYKFDTYSARLRSTIDHWKTTNQPRSVLKSSTIYKIRRDNLVNFCRRVFMYHRCMSSFIMSGGSIDEMITLVRRLFDETQDYDFEMESNINVALTFTLPRATDSIRAYISWIAANALNNSSHASDDDTEEGDGGATII